LSGAASLGLRGAVNQRVSEPPTPFESALPIPLPSPCATSAAKVAMKMPRAPVAGAAPLPSTGWS
jgi:hypothetical protein